MYRIIGKYVLYDRFFSFHLLLLLVIWTNQHLGYVHVFFLQCMLSHYILVSYCVVANTNLYTWSEGAREREEER